MPLAAKLTLIIGAASVAVVLFGGVYRLSADVIDVKHRLDRNCRVLVGIQADTRFLIVEHAGEVRGDLSSEAYREIFRNAAREGCG